MHFKPTLGQFWTIDHLLQLLSVFILRVNGWMLCILYEWKDVCFVFWYKRVVILVVCASKLVFFQYIHLLAYKYSLANCLNHQKTCWELPYMSWGMKTAAITQEVISTRGQTDWANPLCKLAQTWAREGLFMYSTSISNVNVICTFSFTLVVILRPKFFIVVFKCDYGFIFIWQNFW